MASLKTSTLRASLTCALVAVLGVFGLPARAASPDLSGIRLPAGFSIETWAEGVTNARSLALGDGGTLFVGTRSAGKVYAVRSRADGSREVLTIASGLNMPNGIAFRDGALYVAEVQRISIANTWMHGPTEVDWFFAYDPCSAPLDAAP